ncbi:MAG: sigma-70 family RNA polymerase sigma factor [Bacteroidaceae bacterium]|nr:sigma-70 family RNA polymerase sigma factor [Bacteroidaceae bacterium]
MRNLQNKTDMELVYLYQKGSNDAFDVLLKRYKNKLYSYVFYTVKNTELAEDIFQETFVKAIMTIRQGRYVDNGKFSAWLMRIAHNLIIDHFRQIKTKNVISNDDYDADLLNNYHLCAENIEHELITKQILSDVRELMTLLPENQREVITMRFYQDLSFKEIAERCDVSINTALGRMRYAVLNLRKIAVDRQMVLTLD